MVPHCASWCSTLLPFYLYSSAIWHCTCLSWGLGKGQCGGWWYQGRNYMYILYLHTVLHLSGLSTVENISEKNTVPITVQYLQWWSLIHPGPHRHDYPQHVASVEVMAVRMVPPLPFVQFLWVISCRPNWTWAIIVGCSQYSSCWCGLPCNRSNSPVSFCISGEWSKGKLPPFNRSSYSSTELKLSMVHKFWTVWKAFFVSLYLLGTSARVQRLWHRPTLVCMLKEKYCNCWWASCT